MLKRILASVAIAAFTLTLFALGVSLAQPALTPAQGLDSGLPGSFLEAWPVLGIILGTGAVLLAAEVVKSAVQWLKVRLERRMLDVPHALIHGMNLLLSAGVAWAFIAEGRLAADPVFGALPWPINILVFTAAVFWRAGGKKDEEIEEARAVARFSR